MADYTVVNFKSDVEDMAPKFGYSPGSSRASRARTSSWRSRASRTSSSRPTSRSRSGTRTASRKRSTSCLDGSARAKIGDEIDRVQQWDAIRVPRACGDSLAGGPDGAESSPSERRTRTTRTSRCSRTSGSRPGASPRRPAAARSRARATPRTARRGRVERGGGLALATFDRYAHASTTCGSPAITGRSIRAASRASTIGRKPGRSGSLATGPLVGQSSAAQTTSSGSTPSGPASVARRPWRSEDRLRTSDTVPSSGPAKIRSPSPSSRTAHTRSSSGRGAPPRNGPGPRPRRPPRT